VKVLRCKSYNLRGKVPPGEGRVSGLSAEKHKRARIVPTQEIWAIRKGKAFSRCRERSSVREKAVSKKVERLN